MTALVSCHDNGFLILDFHLYPTVAKYLLAGHFDRRPLSTAYTSININYESLQHYYSFQQHVYYSINCSYHVSIGGWSDSSCRSGRKHYSWAVCHMHWDILFNHLNSSDLCPKHCARICQRRFGSQCTNTNTLHVAAIDQSDEVDTYAITTIQEDCSYTW